MNYKIEAYRCKWIKILCVNIDNRNKQIEECLDVKPGLGVILEQKDYILALLE